MSHQWIANALTAGSRVGANLVLGQQGPEDAVSSKVHELLSADSFLATLFQKNAAGDALGIELWDIRPFWDFGDLPKLQVYTASTTESTRPTEVAVKTIEVFVGIRYDVDNVAQRAPWTCGIASLVNYVRTLLRNKVQLDDQVNDMPISLASKSTPSPVNFLLDAETGTERIAATQEFSMIYTVNVNDLSGKIRSVESVGG